MDKTTMIGKVRPTPCMPPCRQRTALPWMETAPQTKSIKGIRGPKADAAKHLKDSYQRFRSVQQTAEKKTKKKTRPNGRTGIRSRVRSGGGSQLQREGVGPETKESAVEFVRKGGGLVLVHAANNAFPIGMPTMR